jgi:short-subunit dehydrogenase
MPRPRLHPLRDQTLVITGASSGIGLATALAAAERGAGVVLVARNGEALERIAGEIQASSAGAALAVEADVADRSALEAVADRAIERFGGFDTWVNCAGVDLWGRLADVADDDHRRLFETNFWGVVYGSLVAAERLRRRGGAIVNVGSLESDRAFPLQGMYAASKHAVKGFTDALRMELEHEGAPISLTLVKPGSMGTPLPDHAKTYLERAPRLPPPVYRPEESARAILRAAEHPIRDVYVGGQARAVVALADHAPRLLDRLSERRFVDAQLSERSAAGRRDNLHQPGLGGRVQGRYPGRLVRSLYTRAVLRPAVTSAVVLTALGVAGAATAYRRR